MQNKLILENNIFGNSRTLLLPPPIKETKAPITGAAAVAYSSSCLSIEPRNAESIKKKTTSTKIRFKLNYLLRKDGLSIFKKIKALPGLKLELSDYVTYHKSLNTGNPIGDNILRTFTFPSLQKDKPQVLYITSLQSSANPESKEYLKKAFLPLDDIIKNKRPKWLLIDVGQAPVVLTKTDQQNQKEKLFVEIAGEINFQIPDLENHNYKYELIFAADFLINNPEIAWLAGKNNSDTDILNAGKLLVCERIDTPNYEKLKKPLGPAKSAPADITVSSFTKLCNKNNPLIEKILENKRTSVTIKTIINYFLKTPGISKLAKISPFFVLFKKIKSKAYLTYHAPYKPKFSKPSAVSKDEDRYRTISDEILTVIPLHNWKNTRNPLGVFISCMQAGAAEHSRDYMDRAYLSIAEIIKKQTPRYIIIDAGPKPEIFNKIINEGTPDQSTEQYVLIKNEINFKLFERNFYKYESRLVSAVDFLLEHPELNELARKNNINIDILLSNKLLVSERVDVPLKDVIKHAWDGFNTYKAFRFAVLGNLLFSFGTGLLQGMVLPLMTDMIDNKYKLIDSVFIFSQFLYFNILHLMDVATSTKADDIRDAEKSGTVELSRINEELRSRQTRLAKANILSIVFSLFLFPAFFTSIFGALPYVTVFLFILYFGNELIKDLSGVIENNNFFRILRNTIGTDPVYSNNLLRIKSVELVAQTFFSTAGFAASYLLIKHFPFAGIISGFIGAALSIAGKFIYPYYSQDFPLQLNSNFEITKLDGNDAETTYEIIPDKVCLTAKTPLMFYAKNKQKWQGGVNPEEIELIIDKPDIDSLPTVFNETPRRLLSNAYKTWKLKWPNGKTITFRLTSKQKIKLVPMPMGKKVKLVFRPI